MGLKEEVVVETPGKGTGVPEEVVGKTSSMFIVSPAVKKSLDLAKRFHTLFSGLERAHGTYNNIDNTREDGKRQGQAITKREPVTDALWADHLSGVNGIGIIPIRDDSTVVFGAIDVDVYAGLNLVALAASLRELKLPLVPCRSKSGGAHLYLFTKDPVPAAAMQDKLRGLAALLGYGTAEIFPKQTSMQPGTSDIGSWINAPYAGGDDTNRYALNPDGDGLSAEEFLAYAEGCKVGPEWFSQPLRKSEGLLPDAPPCLQHLIEQGIPEGGRNKTLFNLAVYCRKAGDDWQDKVQELNQRHLKPALPHAEVLTIIKSVSRKQYGYACSDVPLSSYCDKAQCMKRTLGIGAGGKGLVQGLADAITATDHFARDKGDQLYVFRDGVYRDDGRRFIKLRTKQLLDEWKKSKDWSPELPLRVEQWLLADAPDLWEQPPLDTLNCRNGLLDIETRTLRPHDPGHLSPVQIAACFDPHAVSVRIWPSGNEA